MRIALGIEPVHGFWHAKRSHPRMFSVLSPLFLRTKENIDFSSVHANKAYSVLSNHLSCSPGHL